MLFCSVGGQALRAGAAAVASAATHALHWSACFPLPACRAARHQRVVQHQWQLASNRLARSAVASGNQQLSPQLAGRIVVKALELDGKHGAANSYSALLDHGAKAADAAASVSLPPYDGPPVLADRPWPPQLHARLEVAVIELGGRCSWATPRRRRSGRWWRTC